MRDYDLLVLYGSQTGNAEDVAYRIFREASRRHKKAIVKSCDQYGIQNLIEERFVLFVVSTTGQGDPPDNMKNFWRFIWKKVLPSDSLRNLTYAVVALGDSSYDQYNMVGKKLHRRLQLLGAVDVAPCCLGDDQHEFGYNAGLNPWLVDFWQSYLAIYPMEDGCQIMESDILLPSRFNVRFLSEDEEARFLKTNDNNKENNRTDNHTNNTNNNLIHNQTNNLTTNYNNEKQNNTQIKNNNNLTCNGYCESNVLSSKRLTPLDHWQNVILATFDTTMLKNTFGPGDVCWVRPHNNKTDVTTFLNILRMRGSSLFKWECTDFTPFHDYPLPSPCTLEHLLTHHLELTALPRDYFWEVMAKLKWESICGGWRGVGNGVGESRGGDHFDDGGSGENGGKSGEIDKADERENNSNTDRNIDMNTNITDGGDEEDNNFGDDDKDDIKDDDMKDIPKGRDDNDNVSKSNDDVNNNISKSNDDDNDNAPTIDDDQLNVLKIDDEKDDKDDKEAFELEQERLQEFDSYQRIDDLYDYCYRPRRNILEILADFPHSCRRLSLARLLEIIPPIKSRPFSIASSPLSHPTSLDLLVAVVNYKTKLYSPRLGLCSNYIASLLPTKDKVLIKVTKGTFRMSSILPTSTPHPHLSQSSNPTNLSSTITSTTINPTTINLSTITSTLPIPPHFPPVVMVGPGTGCAPFRSLILHRCMLNMTENYMFYGSRNRKKDFFFEEEWNGLVERTFLHLFAAFSRDQKYKIYVQDILRENEKLIFDLIFNKNGHFFLAGSSKNMPEQVKEAIEEIIIKNAPVDGQRYQRYVDNMIKEGRYQSEVW